MIHHHITKVRVRALIGIVLGTWLLLQCHDTLSERASQRQDRQMASAWGGVLRSNEALASLFREARAPLQPRLEQLADNDPVGFFEMLLDRYDRSVRDYICVFTKQELVCGRMTAKQVMKAHFREDPFSVRLEWIENRDKAARVLYVEDAWVQKGRQMAVVEPGPIARIFVPYVMRPIHGEDAKKASRRTIDQFGFRNSLQLILKYCRLARAQGILDFTYEGTRVVDGRDTLLFERRLPYTGEEGPWPDGVLEVYVDKQLLVPTLCLAYADQAKDELLGHYQYTDIEINANLDRAVFTKEGMGVE